MPHPRLQGEPLRTRSEQIIAELATEHLDSEPTERKLPLPGGKKPGSETQKAVTLNH